MRDWQQKVINQTIKTLILPLPEDYCAYIRDYQNQLRNEGYTNAEISLLLLKDVQGFWAGFIQKTIPDFLKDLFQRIDPSYWTYNIYAPYGNEAIEKIKNDFQEDFYKINLQSMQISLTALIVFHLVLAVLDNWCLPETRNIAWSIKFFVLSILFISAFLAFKSKQFEKYNQKIIIVSVITSALGFILTMSFAHFHEFGQYTYYGTLMLLLFSIYLSFGLRFWNTVIVSIIILLEYLIINHFIQPIALSDRLQFLRYFSNTALIVTSLGIGVIASNLIEQNMQLSFLIRYAIAMRFKEFLTYAKSDSIETFLNYIKRIRHSPQILKEFMVQTFDRSLSCDFLEGYRNISFNYLSSNKNHEDIHKQSKLKEDIEKIEKEQKEEKEKHFLSDYFYGSVKGIRLVSILAIIDFGGFGIIDIICLPETNYTSIYIRELFCIASLIVFIISFYQDFFEKYYQPIMMILASISAIGIALMIAFSKPTEIGYTTYYAGLIQVLFYVFIFSRFLLVNAISVGILTIIGYIVAASYFQNLLTSAENISLFINNLLQLIICCIIGSLSCHLIEKNARLEFETRYGLAKKSQELLGFYEEYKPSPQELLEMINEIRHNPEELKKFLEQSLTRS